MKELDKIQFQIALQEHKIKLEQYIRYNLDWNTIHGYLLIDISPYEKFHAQVIVEKFQWNHDEHLYCEKEIGVRKHLYINKFSAFCKFRFMDKSVSGTPTYIQDNLEITCKYQFDLDLDNSSPTLELLDEKRMLMSKHNESIFNFYKTKGIYGDDFLLNTDRLDERFRQALFNTKLQVDLNPFDIWFEILYCLQRVRFCIGNMALYHPYLDNPIWHGHPFQKEVVYPSHATLYDERYFTYCEFAYQSLYNFWGRVGYTLNKVVSTNLKERDVDFARVVDAIAKRDVYSSSNSHFLWLKNIKETDYNSMNADRRQTVHYETVTSKMSRLHMKGFTDHDEVEERQKWIEGRVDYFVDHFQKCVEGLRQLTLFLEAK